ncbi:DUF3137 domain-containing protein [Marivirga sp.]|uniref:DUF3137 domain-containing protein n=1 Tax=Marivirga sp. TaxID=2018662 RepID=UPI002D7E410B|nr:DUF3137 domain-containing protein [Marivirga sp.]HET8858351.1 DUF3137 domain-containing protein [Marivirga sp.]
MENIKSFDELYETVLVHEIEKQEEQRKSFKKRFLIILFATYSLIILSAFIFDPIFFPKEDQGRVMIYVWVAILSILPFVFFFRRFSKSFTKVYKDNVIQKLVHFVDNDLSYNAVGGFPKSQYLRSELFNRTPDKYKAEDLVEGKVGQTHICFSEVKSEYKTKSGSGKDRKTEWHTIFEGIFFEADFNKDFSTKTFILPDYLERTLGFLGKKLQSFNVGRPPLVKLEDPEFEKYFVVYGEDQVEARYILSTSLMKRLTDFAKKRKLPVYISFVGNSVFIAIYEIKNLFEPRIFRTNLNKELILEYYNMLELVIGLVEDLNLNNRIWAGSKMESGT